MDTIKYTSSEWGTFNSVLANGQYGLELDTKKTKIGNGQSKWLDLSYISSSGAPEANVILKSFTNSTLDLNYDLVISTPDCITFEITIQKPDATLMLTDGLVEKTSINEIKVHFGEPISTGTWYYIIKYYIETTI